MTLAEEKEMEIVRNALTYVNGDHHSPEPHWHIKYLWTEDSASLPNKRVVEATFLRTEKQLAKEPEWMLAYTSEVHEMVNRKAAVKLSKEVLQSCTGPVWYISHLITPNPHSVSTPVRLVWNSSQKHRGLSLNNILIKGTDVLNLIRGSELVSLLLLVTSTTMYNYVWLEGREVHLHWFLWCNTEDAEIEDFAITSQHRRQTCWLHGPSCHARDCQLAPIQALHRRETSLKLEFFMKPWVYSNQSGRKEPRGGNMESKTMILPNQLTEEDNKALHH
ncbi:hypothetical protein L3Q82_025481 [Scortum barcoo]|uniref:Uncharacterized protein n=1 Tax=Scortum barcoo TaxID=214431 RepID=A0ACB8WLC1_9TELE|nr:hypothetical protein L3Q82_025481 [Scortum barcoo]